MSPVDDAVVADIRPGAVLGERYQIRGLIARGGMATVYLAVDQRLERTVALKVMHPAYASDPSFVDRFVREALSIARLSHPNVVAVYDQGSHHGLAYLVMEYVQGRTLREVLASRGRLSPAEAAGVLDPLLAGLAAAHRIGMVHRDVKPENVLIGNDGTVKVADFGLARIAESSRATTKGVMMATVAYVAPEIVTVGSSDPRADVYAAGIVLFEMLTGAPPFQGDSPVQVAYQHVHSEMPAPADRMPDIPPALDQLAVRATRRDPDERPVDAAAMLADLRAASAGPMATTVPMDLLATAPVSPVPTPQGRHDTLLYAPPDQPGVERRFLPRRVEDSEPVPDLADLPRERSRWPARAVLIGAVLATVLVVAIGIGWWSAASGYTQVPGVVGLAQAQAEAKIRTAHLGLQYGPALYNETAPAGQVLSQQPADGAQVPKNTPITLVLSKGPERHGVPAVVGQPKDTAVQAIRTATLTPQTSTAYDENVPAGNVVSTDPVAGTPLRRGAAVKVVVSKGPQPVQNPLCTPAMRRWAPFLCQDGNNSNGDNNNGNSGGDGTDGGDPTN
ncbi:Stk1 family PASTA domain-containing Ser/Thr kinase [Fodinicola feengrottensis]|uniref:Stk1 family PASTA domain-containing Ser/Thr kinase n=1 Tax=Fodinicola feengrottensis TaxID=435914 RepID=UPI0031DD9143